MKKKYCCIMLIIVMVLSNILYLSNMKVLAAEQQRLDLVVPQDVEPPKSYEEVTSRILEWESKIPAGYIWDDTTPYGDKGYLGSYYYCKADNSRSVGCEAFTRFISDSVFGSLPIRRYTNITFEQIRPGDVLRINKYRHSLIVIAVNDDDSILTAEAGGTVVWNNVRSKEDVMRKINYLETRYPDGFVDGEDTTVPVATAVPVPTSAPENTTTLHYTYAHQQKNDGAYRYLYDSNQNVVDSLILNKGKLRYKNKPIKKFKPIKWADFNGNGNIIVVQKNKVFFSIDHITLKIKRLGKGATKREKKNGLVFNIITEQGKKDVSRK